MFSAHPSSLRPASWQLLETVFKSIEKHLEHKFGNSEAQEMRAAGET